MGPYTMPLTQPSSHKSFSIRMFSSFFSPRPSPPTNLQTTLDPAFAHSSPDDLPRSTTFPLHTRLGISLSETNLYAVLTILAFFFIVPISVAMEPPAAVVGAWSAARAAGNSVKYLSLTSLLAGAFYYLYNEVAFQALGRVNPVTHAVGNTIKRVVIIIASVIAFKTPISTLGVVGSSIAIMGTLLYSLAKNRFG